MWKILDFDVGAADCVEKSGTIQDLEPERFLPQIYISLEGKWELPEQNLILNSSQQEKIFKEYSTCTPRGNNCW